MRYALKVLVFCLMMFSIVGAQELTREQKLQKIDELNNQIKTLEKDVLLPDAKDLEKARKENFNVIRILPREKYDHKLTIRGGGSYYSFTQKSHDYQKTAQIGLEQNSLKVGFAGADYGLIADLGEISLADISKDAAETRFLINYKSPTVEGEARNEYQKLGKGFEVDGINYSNRTPAIVGHSYVLRAITYGEADVLAAFNVVRKDADGSLIIFWKLLEIFETPHLERNKITLNLPPTPANEVKIFDFVTTQAIQSAYLQNGFKNISVEATTTEVVLRGTLPKGRMAEAVRIAQETAKRRVRNQLIEQ